MFLWKYSTENCGENLFFCNKTKTEAYLENRGHAFVDIEKNFSKPNFRQISFDERLKGY